jgi:hypothetical protein
MTDEKPDTFDAWAIIEIMGHDRYAGRVTEEAIGGCAFVRVDVPGTPEQAAFSKLFGQGAIFSITPCTEQEALRAVERFQSRPLLVAGTTQQSLPYYEEDNEEPW